ATARRPMFPWSLRCSSRWRGVALTRQDCTRNRGWLLATADCQFSISPRPHSSRCSTSNWELGSPSTAAFITSESFAKNSKPTAIDFSPMGTPRSLSKPTMRGAQTASNAFWACSRSRSGNAIPVALYWRVEIGWYRSDQRLSEAEWSDKLLSALERAVARRLVADVPVGVLLSGGLDSSLLVGLLARLGQNRIKTFSIGFERVGTIAGD